MFIITQSENIITMYLTYYNLFYTANKFKYTYIGRRRLIHIFRWVKLIFFIILTFSGEIY